MIPILLLMCSGIVIGLFIRNRSDLIKRIDQLVIWSIFILLFLMGMSIGRDPVIMSKLPSLGLTAALISLAGVTGSLFTAWLLWKYLFNKKQ